LSPLCANDSWTGYTKQTARKISIASAEKCHLYAAFSKD